MIWHGWLPSDGRLATAEAAGTARSLSSGRRLFTLTFLCQALTTDEPVGRGRRMTWLTGSVCGILSAQAVRWASAPRSRDHRRPAVSSVAVNANSSGMAIAAHRRAYWLRREDRMDTTPRTAAAHGRAQARTAVMADVAKLAGVSHQTVSRVVNDSAQVRPETRGGCSPRCANSTTARTPPRAPS